MDDGVKHICVVLSLMVVSSLATYFISRHIWQKEADLARVEVKVDTLFIRDTILQNNPVFVEKRIVDSIRIVDTISQTDTQYIYLPREVRRYEDKHYQCEVSGYEPNLDWIEVYPETKYITKEVKVKPKPKRWGLGVSVGYGAVLNGKSVRLSPYVGISLQYNLIMW